MASSAYQRLPIVERDVVLVGALTMFLLFVAVMELRLWGRGIHATTVDSEAVWLHERERASVLGDRAVVLIGASRIQTDVDLDVLRADTGMEPVQLAIDGNSFVPVLAGLARDPRVRGTVVVSFSDDAVAMPERQGRAAETYEKDFELQKPVRLDYRIVEAALTDAVRTRLRSYADGARPISSLMKRIIGTSPQYAVFLPDRSRLADYSQLDRSVAYYNRVVHQLGQNFVIEPGTNYANVDAELAARIDALASLPNDMYLQRAAAIVKDAEAIEARGGRVIFVVMPTAGLIRRMEEHQFPRADFWDRFAAMTHSRAVHWEDVPVLQNLKVPDGSHIDYHDRPALTRVLISVLGLRERDRVKGN